MKSIALATMLLLGLPLTGSGCDKTMIDDVPFINYDLSGSGTPDGGGTVFVPGIPLLGMLIDRVGRPGINLALTDPFGLASATVTPDVVKNQYNAATSANWKDYAPRPYIAENLAVYDGLDGSCTNQLLIGTAGTATRYNTLASVLADDRLYINATQGVCVTYMAVEQATGGDCGGYHPIMNAMNITYNLLAQGKPTGPTTATTFTDGISSDMDGGVATNAPFPFLLSPQ